MFSFNFELSDLNPPKKLYEIFNLIEQNCFQLVNRMKLKSSNTYYINFVVHKLKNNTN